VARKKWLSTTRCTARAGRRSSSKSAGRMGASRPESAIYGSRLAYTSHAWLRDFHSRETQALVTTHLGTSDDMPAPGGFEGEPRNASCCTITFHSWWKLPFSRGAGGGSLRLRTRNFGSVAHETRLALRDARGLGHTGIEWLLIHGHRLWSFAVLMDAGVPLVSPVAGVARIGERRRSVRHLDRHRRRRRSSTVTWTSKSPERGKV